MGGGFIDASENLSERCLALCKKMLGRKMSCKVLNMWGGNHNYYWVLKTARWKKTTPSIIYIAK